MNIIDLWMVDLDGVVNSQNLRDHLIPKKAEQHTASAWMQWHAAHLIEAVNEDMIDRLNEAHARGIKILFCSMRCDGFSPSTYTSLTNAGLEFEPLMWLRGKLDNTTPPEAKVSAVLKAATFADVLGVPMQITFIDDSLANIEAINNSDEIAALRTNHNVSVLPVLFPRFVGFE